MRDDGWKAWLTPAAVIAAGLAVCVTVAWGDAQDRREQRRTQAGLEQIETELRWARSPGR